jgi:mRNA degradation ribonuclease J1/J2
VSSGFINDSDTDVLFQELVEELQQILAANPEYHEEPQLCKSKVRETARDFIAKATNKRPMIIPVVLES